MLACLVGVRPRFNILHIVNLEEEALSTTGVGGVWGGEDRLESVITIPSQGVLLKTVSNVPIGVL